MVSTLYETCDLIPLGTMVYSPQTYQNVSGLFLQDLLVEDISFICNIKTINHILAHASESVYCIKYERILHHMTRKSRTCKTKTS